MRRQRRSQRLLALIVGLSLVAAACGDDADEGDGAANEPAETEVPEGGTLVIGAEQELECADWISTCASASWGTWSLSVQTMPRAFDIVETDDGWEYAPSILLDGEPELEVEPQQVVTYTINDEAVWSDGEPIVCGDFVYTWDQMVNTDDVIDRTGYIDIESVECPDDRTVVVTFAEQFAALPQHAPVGSRLLGLPQALTPGHSRSRRRPLRRGCVGGALLPRPTACA